jgi:hypothetical protein
MAPVQAASLVLVGPFVDFWLTGKRIDKYDYAVPSMVTGQLLNIF